MIIGIDGHSPLTLNSGDTLTIRFEATVDDVGVTYQLSRVDVNPPPPPKKYLLCEVQEVFADSLTDFVVKTLGGMVTEVDEHGDAL